MTLSWLELASVFAVPLLLGAAILRALGLRARDEPLAFAGWAYVAGTLGVGLVLFLWLLLGWPLEARRLVPVCLVLACASWAYGLRWAPGSPGPRADAAVHWSRIERWSSATVVALLLIASLTWILATSLEPVVEGDEASIWAHKAKLLFSAGGLGDALRVEAMQYPRTHLDYPLLNPLLQLWTFAHAGEQLHVENRLPIQGFMLALVLVLASALRRALRPALAALLLLLVVQTVSFQAHLRAAYADGMVALGLVCACAAWLRWKESGSRTWWRLTMLSCAFLVWSKNEGLFYVMLGALVAGASAWLSRRSERGETPPLGRELAWVLLPLSIVAATWIHNGRMGFRNDLLSEASPADFLASFPGRIRPILSALWKHACAEPRHTNHVFVALLALLLASPVRVLRGRTRFAALWVVAILAGDVAVYLATPHDLAWHLSTSLPRVVFQALPLAALCLAVVAASDPYFGRIVGRMVEQRPPDPSVAPPRASGDVR